MKIAFIVFTVIIVILLLTFNIKASVEYDVLKNIGKVKVFLFKFIPIFISTITIAGEYLNFSKQKGKVIKIKIDLKDDKIQFINDVGMFLKRKISILKLHSSVLVCLENPCVSCYIGSIINILILVLYAKLLTYTTDIDLQKSVETGFRQTELCLNFDVSIILSLYDFIWAFLKAYKLKRSRNEKEDKLQQNG